MGFKYGVGRNQAIGEAGIVVNVMQLLEMSYFYTQNIPDCFAHWVFETAFELLCKHDTDFIDVT